MWFRWTSLICWCICSLLEGWILCCVPDISSCSSFLISHGFYQRIWLRCMILRERFHLSGLFEKLLNALGLFLVLIFAFLGLKGDSFYKLFVFHAYVYTSLALLFLTWLWYSFSNTIAKLAITTARWSLQGMAISLRNYANSLLFIRTRL